MTIPRWRYCCGVSGVFDMITVCPPLTGHTARGSALSHTDLRGGGDGDIQDLSRLLEHIDCRAVPRDAQCGLRAIPAPAHWWPYEQRYETDGDVSETSSLQRHPN